MNLLSPKDIQVAASSFYPAAKVTVALIKKHAISRSKSENEYKIISNYSF
jgi:hypothetical protein